MAIKTLSIPADMDEFLRKNIDLSPSKMLQSKIIEIRENRRHKTEQDLIKDRRINFLQNELQKANEKIANGNKN